MSKQTKFVDPKTGRQRCLGGCLPSAKKPPSLNRSTPAQYMSKDLPSAVDLRKFMTPVEQQSDSHSCTANALAAAYEFLIMKDTQQHIDVSRLFIYYNARLKDGIKEYSMKDNGSSIPNAIEALAEFGCCEEELFPFDSTNLNRKPPEKCYAKAVKYRIEEGMELIGDLNEMKSSLAEGHPFVFSIDIFTSFQQAGTNGGRVPMPDLDDKSEYELSGAHAMVAAGYSDRSECFIVRNSWGEDWGHNGYCYIPYEYMCNSERCRDFYSVITITEYPSHGKADEVENSPSDHTDQNTDGQLFWKPDDPHDYYHSIWHDTSAEKTSPNSDSPETHILWVDQDKAELLGMTKHLGSDPRVHITFQETVGQATDYLMRNMSRIKSLPSSSTFQIICRGYYAPEDKNALDLLPILNQHQLEYVPIIVITGDRSGVLNHFKEQAPLMGINDWKSRIYVTDNHADLITKVNANLINKYAGGRRREAD